MHMNFTPKISKLTKDATEYLIFEISRLSSVQVVHLNGVNCSDGFAGLLGFSAFQHNWITHALFIIYS